MDEEFWNNLGAERKEPATISTKVKSFGKAISGDGLYPNERHALLKLSDGTFTRGNYIGPGTRVVQRVVYDHSEPKTEVDKVAMAHDIRYSFARNADDIRQADIKMINKVNDIDAKGQDSKWNISQAKLIGAKIKLEDVGIMNKGSFGGLDQPKEYNDQERQSMEVVLNSLAQQGYGRRRPQVQYF